MLFNVHPDASANFNQEAGETLNLLSIAEIAPSNPSFPSQRFTQPLLLTEIDDLEQGIVDFTGEEIGRYFEFNNSRIGLQGKDYKAFEKLCNGIYSMATIREVISLKVVKNEVFNWLKRRHKNETTEQLFEFVLPEFESIIEEIEVWVPIFGTEIESSFSVGRVLFQPINKLLMDKWCSDLIGIRPKEEINILKGYFDKEREQVQGLAAGTITLRADPIRVGELAIAEVERMLNVVHFFEPSNLHPKLTSHCTILGKQNLQKIKFYRVKEGRLIGSTETLINKVVPHWRIDNDLLAIMKESVLDKINGILSLNKLSPFQAMVIDTLQIYSRVGRAKLYSDKLVYLLVTLETLLLRNGSESIQQNVGERLAFALEKTPENRKKIVKTFKDIYNLRSEFIHHGNDVQLEHLNTFTEFMLNTWNFLQLVIKNADNFRTKEGMIDALENIKFSGIT